MVTGIDDGSGFVAIDDVASVESFTLCALAVVVDVCEVTCGASSSSSSGLLLEAVVVAADVVTVKEFRVAANSCEGISCSFCGFIVTGAGAVVSSLVSHGSSSASSS